MVPFQWLFVDLLFVGLRFRMGDKGRLCVGSFFVVVVVGGGCIECKWSGDVG